MPASLERTRSRPAARGSRWNGSAAAPQRQQAQKRLAILTVAARLFNEHGYHETSLDDIAAALNVSKPTVYYYVRSKEAILVEIASLALRETEARFTQATRSGPSAFDALRSFVRAYVEAMTGDFGRCLLAIRHTRLEPRTRARMRQGFRKIDALMRDVLSAGIADGSIRRCDVRAATFALYGALSWVPHWFRGDGPLDAVQAADAVFDVFAEGLQNAPRRQRRIR